MSATAVQSDPAQLNVLGHYTVSEETRVLVGRRIRLDADGGALDGELELDEDCEGHDGLLWLEVPLHFRCPTGGRFVSAGLRSCRRSP
jgi:hypothetical protein